VNELVVFSHVRWHLVHQRPQHIMSRLARRWRVLFVEEPVFATGAPRADLRAPQNGVTVMTPYTPLTAPGFHDAQIPLLQKLVGHAVVREGFTDYGAWLYTPMALPLLQKLAPRIVVYDCMEDLAALPSAPRQLLQRENALMRIANVVFAGGPSLCDARSSRHPSVHLFSSSVDRVHFARAGDATYAHAEIRPLARPRLGFFGVLDERLDFALLGEVARRRPEWELCMVGPLTKVDAGSLPQAPNLHYYGLRSHDELPAFLAGWDVALLPFARNDATRHISPGTTLEYMTAGCPIVATPVGDIARLHGAVVRFGATAGEFIAACEAALVEPQAERVARRAAMQCMLDATSWDATVQQMKRIVEDAARRGLSEAARTMLEPVKPFAAAPATPLSRRAPCLILGAGPTGLAAAYHCGAASVALERETKPGGSCRSIEDTGFTFDYAGHIMFSHDPYVQELYRLLLGDNVHWQAHDAWIYSKGTYVRCPPSFAPGPTGAGARFGYPLRGGFQALMNGFLPLLRGELVLQANVICVSPRSRNVTLADGRHFRYDALISTLPLPTLIEAIGDEAPPDVRRAASELRHGSMRCVNLGVARRHVTDKHWIHFAGDTVFQRVFVQGNASPHCNPPGGCGLTCEIGYSRAEPLPATGAALIERCVRDCVRVGLLDASDALLTSNELDVRYACIVDDPGRAERVARIRDWLCEFDIILAGRYSEWQHSDWDHAFVAGKKAAELALQRTAGRPAAMTA